MFNNNDEIDVLNQSAVYKHVLPVHLNILMHQFLQILLRSANRIQTIVIATVEGEGDAKETENRKIWSSSDAVGNLLFGTELIK